MSTNVYRAIVSYSNSSTGEILVRIPAKFGPEVAINISTIGRSAYNGSWSVPQIGSQIVVTADDEAFTNVFWVQTNPTEPVSLDGVESDIANLQSEIETLQSNLETNIETNISTINAQIQELQSFATALALGIFR